MTEKKYLMFAGMYFYPRGGFNDFRGTIEESHIETYLDINLNDNDWMHLVDPITKKIIMWIEL